MLSNYSEDAILKGLFVLEAAEQSVAGQSICPCLICHKKIDRLFQHQVTRTALSVLMPLFLFSWSNISPLCQNNCVIVSAGKYDVKKKCIICVCVCCCKYVIIP